MAIHHPIGGDDVSRLARGVGLSLRAARGVERLSLNTTYALECAEGRYFLRSTRLRGAAELDYEAALLAHLHGAGFPCARPLAAAQGGCHQPHEGGLVSVFPALPGEALLSADAVTADQAFRAGEALGRLHRLATSFGQERVSPGSPQEVGAWLRDLEPGDDAGLRAALPDLKRALGFASRPRALPLGTIHGDFFRDNVLFLGGQVSGVLDFEMAGTGPWLVDVGIGLCEWTFSGRFEPERMARFCEGYVSQRRFLPGEADGLWPMALFASVRFAVTRIRDYRPLERPPVRLVKDWRRYVARVRELAAMGEAGLRRACGV